MCPCLTTRKMHSDRPSLICPGFQIFWGSSPPLPGPAHFTAHMRLTQPRPSPPAAPLVPLGEAQPFGRFVLTQVHACCLDSEPRLAWPQHFPTPIPSNSLLLRGFQLLPRIPIKAFAQLRGNQMTSPLGSSSSSAGWGTRSCWGVSSQVGPRFSCSL